MNAIDILGELLGHKTRQKSRGGNVLNDIFGQNKKQASNPPPKPHEIAREAEELEDLLNVANEQVTNRRSGRTAPPPTKSRRYQRKELPAENDQALLLIRAMVNAAKADGKLDQSEQNKILEHLDSPDRSTMDFLRQEFSAPLDLPAFIRSVPVGMEQKVYMMSLIAIDLDTGTEADYLIQLSKGLRLSDDVRENIHERLGAPSIY